MRGPRSSAAIARSAIGVTVLAALFAACGAPAPTGPFTTQGEAAADRIDGSLIRSVVREISDDRYAGRAPGTTGDAMTREYLIEQLKTIGFEPGEPGGGWQQPFELIGLNAMQPRRWRFERGDAQLVLAQADDFIVASGLQSPQASVTNSELVFVGYGIEAPEYDWDDFKGADLSGKVLVMMNNDPDWDPELFEGVKRLYYGRWTYKYESAARQGAAGAIIIHTPASAGYPWQVVQSSWSGTQFELPAGDEPRMQVEAWITENAARRLLALSGHTLEALTEQAKRRDFEPVPLGVTTSMTLPVELSDNETANVVGVLPGSDPALADEYVVYTAHHDHLGVGAPNPADDPNDRIYNGARDNASGVGMIMSIGRALASLDTPPRRSIMLLFVGAEEQGLLGSQYFAEHPSVAPGRIAADINYDSGNIWGRTHDITFVGFGKSSLDDVAERVAAHQDRVVEPDQFPDRGYYYRSDQFNFARIGVPSFYFDPGKDFVGRPEGWGVERINEYTERNYHQPSDEYSDDWNLDGMIEDARFGFWAGLIIANVDAMPQWNPGDEFEAARKRALDAVQ